VVFLQETNSKVKIWVLLLPVIFKVGNITVADYMAVTLEVVGFEVLTAVVMKSTVFWDITPSYLLKVN
jgi:hypothetical protein